MAYRSFRGGSGRLDTRLDTPPFSHRHHPVSRIALETVGLAPVWGLEVMEEDGLAKDLLHVLGDRHADIVSVVRDFETGGI
jgi:hypothetical protein